ncbi:MULTISPECIES: tol-pal system protein YbgF [Stenotrophomonas]|jgi:tol-pal system protein YbgF|uniref:Cell division coordinator CpoB n=1 Tax=Stenotrophomonas bentonitica TaxID=1450134 RepID=A0ABU9JHP7_9GAMM|nr:MULTISPECIES: tol-pal system protein YbgF [Stenotrophomonas]MCX2921684.1 tol-pal system protein YbgF [Stenotrophomonas rhizophila]MDX5514415.1 tol-pal system protein YbgF [Stenotrophomonas sp. RG-453]WIA61941.1 tol-pal system protein YbgF [Stenotrophomonas sp. BIO128-Bstrain]
MRFRFLSMIVAAALVAAAPANAQRQSLADRVGALEQQANNNQSNMDMLNQLNQLRTQLQALQSQVEQLQHDNEQLKQTGKDQYLDLDSRLNRLEGGAPVLPAAPAAAATAPAAPPKPATAASERPPSVHGDAGSLAASGDERTAYNVAFDSLKAGKYDDSAQLFMSFLELYPNGVYTPNALYWLGESYYATRNFPLAEAQFRDLISRYPTHDKASGGLLKIGLSQYGEGKVDQAQATLEQVVSTYPGSDAARTAQDRLQSIRLGQQIR